ncbi:hypothetical protein, partial [Phenylobacterium sp.]|uniref:hypothetical protein n=1 Tax=Phenylobacterium sp. TaxID=1871053 RepID=UPI0027193BF7
VDLGLGDDPEEAAPALAVGQYIPHQLAALATIGSTRKTRPALVKVVSAKIKVTGEVARGDLAVSSDMLFPLRSLALLGLVCPLGLHPSGGER